MGFFETFWTWLNEQLTRYVGDNTAKVSDAVEPAIVTLAVIYIMIWERAGNGNQEKEIPRAICNSPAGLKSRSLRA